MTTTDESMPTKTTPSETSGQGALPIRAALGLGSNIGDKAGNVRDAIARISADPAVTVMATSHFYRTAPWGVTDQDWFVNAAILIDTTLAPEALLRLCQKTENDMGRVRLRRWGSRIIDVDVLTYGDQVIHTDDLVVPHPLISERAFVLQPLCDLDPGIVIDGTSVEDLARALGDNSLVVLDQP